MRPPPAGLINFINVSSCSLIKWAGRVEETWEKFMYMLLHYCTPERERVKEVAELRKQTQWPREKKCGCSHIHLIWLVRAAVYFPTQFLLLCRFSVLWFYVTRQKITFCQTTFQAPHLTQFTPACWAVSFTICTVGIVISLFIHPSKSSFHHPLPSTSINLSSLCLSFVATVP